MVDNSFSLRFLTAIIAPQAAPRIFMNSVLKKTSIRRTECHFLKISLLSGFAWARSPYTTTSIIIRLLGGAPATVEVGISGYLSRYLSSTFRMPVNSVFHSFDRPWSSSTLLVSHSNEQWSFLKSINQVADNFSPMSYRLFVNTGPITWGPLRVWKFPGPSFNLT